MPAIVTQMEDDRAIKGFTRDISKEGLFILTRHPFPPGSKVKVELLHKDRATKMAGVVVHAALVPHALRNIHAAGMGVEILSTGGADGVASRDTRIDTNAEAVVFFGSERHLLALHDLSTTGAAIVSDFELPEVSFVRMHLRLAAEADLIEIDAVPMRRETVDGGSLTAVRFLDPPDDVVERIRAFVAGEDRTP